MTRIWIAGVLGLVVRREEARHAAAPARCTSVLRKVWKTTQSSSTLNASNDPEFWHKDTETWPRLGLSESAPAPANCTKALSDDDDAGLGLKFWD